MTYKEERQKLELQLKRRQIEKFRLMTEGSHIELCNIEQEIRLISRQLVRLEAIKAVNPGIFKPEKKTFYRWIIAISQIEIVS